MIWARNIRFGDATDNTLNYDIRMLGRRGVLSLNMVSSISQLPDIRTAASNLGSAAAFKAGARYADFNASTDDKAEYGLAGLVAAGVGVAAAKKFGLLALLAVFGKKAFIVIEALLIAGLSRVKRLFRRSDA